LEDVETYILRISNLPVLLQQPQQQQQHIHSLKEELKCQLERAFRDLILRLGTLTTTTKRRRRRNIDKIHTDSTTTTNNNNTTITNTSSHPFSENATFQIKLRKQITVTATIGTDDEGQQQQQHNNNNNMMDYWKQPNSRMEKELLNGTWVGRYHHHHAQNNQYGNVDNNNNNNSEQQQQQGSSSSRNCRGSGGSGHVLRPIYQVSTSVGSINLFSLQ